MKNKAKSIIEIKGKRYDSTTGLPVLSDVFASGGDTSPKPVQLTAKPADSLNIVAKPARKHKPHSVASHASRHQRESSQTLNRKAVKRPETRQKPAIKVSRTAAATVTYKANSSLVKQSAGTVNPAKAERASKSVKSASINHFTSHNAVRPATAEKTKSVSQPTVSRGTIFDIKPRTETKAANSATVAPAANISTPVAAGSHFGAMLDQSEKVNNHRYLEYTPVKKRTGLSRLSKGGRRALAFGITGLAVLTLAGYAVFLNKANIELQLADAKAGINATLPSYKPSGYSVGKFNYQPGRVAINYTSDDGHNYRLTQQASRLDSTALGQQLTAASNKDYQTLRASGQTIFASTDGTSASAAWVSGGILYQLDAHASLSPEQITKIATST